MSSGRKKRSRPKDANPKRDDSGSGGVAKTKRLIRGVERLLRKENLSSEIRAAQEQKLAKLKHQMEQQTAASENKNLEIKMSLKYRKAKFFEKQKIKRKLDQIARKEAAGDGDPEELSAQRLGCQRDLLYIANFPRNEPYISLFVPAERETPELCAKREAMRKTIDEAVARKQQSRHAVDQEQEHEFEADDQDDFFVAPSESEEAEPESPKKKKKKKAEPEVDQQLQQLQSSHKKKKKKKSAE